MPLEHPEYNHWGHPEYNDRDLSASKKTGWWKTGFPPREIRLNIQMNGGGRFGFLKPPREFNFMGTGPTEPFRSAMAGAPNYNVDDYP